MDSKVNPVYKDFEVHTEWVHEAMEDTLIAYLPGFKKEQLKVQVTRGGNLRISGERPIGGNKFSRFYKEIPLPSDCDQNKIRANFRNGMLHVKHPKLIVPADEQLEQAKSSAQVPKSDQNDLAARPPRPREQSNGPEQALQEAPPKASMEKQADEKTDELAKEADNVGEKAADKEMEMKDKTNASNGSGKPMEKKKNGWDQEEKTSSSEERGKLDDSVEDAAEKEAVKSKKLDGSGIYQLGINMDSKLNPVSEDFEVHTEWVHEAMEDTLIAYLPGFKKQQLKVQVTTGGNLRISGERPIGGNKFNRFYKEIPLPSDCDQNKIRANFRNGVLHVKHPKLIVLADEQLEQAKPSAQVPKSDQNDLAAQPPRPREQSNCPEQALQEAPPKASMEKQADEKTDELAKEADNVGEKAADKEMEMKDKTNAPNGSGKPMEKDKNGWDQEEKTSSSEEREKLDDSVEDAAEKGTVIKE